MKTLLKRLGLGQLWLAIGLTSAHGQGTAFTYQGRLNAGTNPVTGSYDLRFAVYDALALGSQQGPFVTNTVTGVTNGLFVVTLDFGNQFSSPGRWLEIAVQTNGGNGFTTLSPRQALTPTPYAITAGSVLAGGLAAGTYGNALTLSNAANSILGAFSGNGANIYNVNAVTLNGLSSQGFWQTNGNAGADPANGAFIGTTDNLPLEFKVNGIRAWRVEPASIGAPNLIGGSPGNYVSNGVVGATIAGGGTTNFLVGNRFTNSVTANFGTVSGGFQNSARGQAAVVGGGFNNTAAGIESFVGGGVFNAASGYLATVGGGFAQGASGSYSTIAGGYNNTASATNSTVAGGLGNSATALNATVSGGDDNQAVGTNTTVGGGYGNRAEGAGAVVAGGGFDGTTSWGNDTAGAASVIGGGMANYADAYAYGATISGGIKNYAVNTNATVGGGLANYASGVASSIGGGVQNLAGGDQATIGGGATNHAAGSFGTVGGGQNNMAGDRWAVIGGGLNNETAAGSWFATIAGGQINAVSAEGGTVGGGLANTVSGRYATVPGGNANTAAGLDSFAAGRFAQASHDGTFVWSDLSSFSGFSSTAVNQFLIRAAGGVGIGTTTPPPGGLNVAGGGLAVSGASSPVYYGAKGVFIENQNTYGAAYAYDYSGTGAPLPLCLNTPGGNVGIGTSVPAYKLQVAGNCAATTFVTTSDRNAKENFKAVDAQTVLDQVAALPVSRWNYKEDQKCEHIGPMAQDFYAAFKVGPDDKHITTVDESGVALAAIQGLNQKLEEVRAENAELKQELSEIKRLLLKRPDQHP